MSNRVEGEFPWWHLPDCTGEQNRFSINWSQVDPVNLGHTEVTDWKLEFYTDEADPQQYCQDKPRLDIKLTLADHSWIRWHPDAEPIRSTEVLPSKAMEQRQNRQKKQMKQMGLLNHDQNTVTYMTSIH